MSYKGKMAENPVGDDPAWPKFNFRRSQVLVALLFVAIGLSIYKYVEQTYIAPRQPIRWRDFSIDAYLQAQRSGRTVLVLVSGAGQEDSQREMRQVTSAAKIQQLVYRLNAEALQLRYPTIDDVTGSEKVRWIEENLKEDANANHSDEQMNGLLVFSPKENRPRFFPADSISVDAIVECLDEIYRA